MLSNEQIITLTADFVQDTLKNAEGGHDWWHILRVWKLARHIASKENVNVLVVELGALLHDIADPKFHDNNEDIGPQIANDFLNTLKIDKSIINHVEMIIRNISFKGRQSFTQSKSPELNVVQDADRLDALGAIGIARTFSYGGYKAREIYNPEKPAKPGMSKDEYIKNTGPSINHFYEKLLLLKDMMNTETGKQMAIKRHNYMLQFLDEFYLEWDGIA